MALRDVRRSVWDVDVENAVPLDREGDLAWLAEGVFGRTGAEDAIGEKTEGVAEDAAE